MLYSILHKYCLLRLADYKKKDEESFCSHLVSFFLTFQVVSELFVALLFVRSPFLVAMCTEPIEVELTFFSLGVK